MTNVKIFYLISVMSDNNLPLPSNTSTLHDLSKAKTRRIPDLTPLAHEDIRLCTINRADPTDLFGIELNFHRQENFHSLSITPGQDNGPSSEIFLIRLDFSTRNFFSSLKMLNLLV